MTKWDQIKEIKGLLAALVGAFTVVSVIGLALMEWRINVNVADELSKYDIGTDAKIVDMDSNIAANKALGERNKEEIDDAERRVEQAFEILMGRD